MKKVNKGVLISCSILGAIFVVASVFALCSAFNVIFVRDLEIYFRITLGWSWFDLLYIGEGAAIISIVAMVIILVVSSNKDYKKSKKIRNKH